MKMELHNTMPFGKYKGQTVEAIFKENAGYLVWLRQRRKDNNAEPNFFSLEVSALLDMAIRDSKQLQKTYKPWNLSIEQAVSTVSPQVREPEREMTYNGWGQF